MEYSKNDMPKKALRSIVEATLKDTIDELGVSQITVAYYRPENIKDLLSKAKLHQAKGKEVSTYYGMRPTTYIGSPQFFTNSCARVSRDFPFACSLRSL